MVMRLGDAPLIVRPVAACVFCGGTPEVPLPLTAGVLQFGDDCAVTVDGDELGCEPCLRLVGTAAWRELAQRAELGVDIVRFVGEKIAEPSG